MTNQDKITTLKRAIKHLRSEGCCWAYLCNIDGDITVPKGYYRYEWKHFIHAYKPIAEEKFAGEYWMGTRVWWSINRAYGDGKISEVYELKAQFLEYILNDITK